MRERKIVVVMNVHEHGSDIIRSIMEGNNRIGKVYTFQKNTTAIRLEAISCPHPKYELAE